MKRTAIVFLLFAVLLCACSIPPQADPSTSAQPTALTEPDGQPTAATATDSASEGSAEPALEESREPASEEPVSGLRLLAVFDETSPGSYASMAVSEEEAVILLAGYLEGEKPERRFA